MFTRGYFCDNKPRISQWRFWVKRLPGDGFLWMITILWWVIFRHKGLSGCLQTDRFPRQAAETQLNLGKPEAASILVKARTNGTSAWMIFWCQHDEHDFSSSNYLNLKFHFHAISIHLWLPCRKRSAWWRGRAEPKSCRRRRSGIHVSSFSDENCCVFHGNVGCGYISFIFHGFSIPKISTPWSGHATFPGHLWFSWDMISDIMAMLQWFVWWTQKKGC